MKRTGTQISVRTLICVIFLCMMLGTIALNFLLSSAFLERYYISSRKKELIRDYRVLQAASVEDLLETDDFDLSLRRALRRNNASLLVMDSETRTLKVWSADAKLMEERLYANLFGATPFLTGRDRKPKTEVKSGDSGDSATAPQAEEEDQSSEYVITDLLERDAAYTIHVVLARSAGTKSMEMWGPLGESSFFLLRTPLEDIRSSARTAIRFYGLIGLLVAAFGALLAWLLSWRITEPLHRLTEISVRMRELDFSAKYEGKSRTELDTLGRSMNELSQKLESTISALRTANNDLQRDLDRRNRQEEMRQEFLSNVTHELKTPIALVRGYAEGLRDGIADDPESRAYYLDTIIEESDRMNTIVQKVLLLNQLEFGDDAVSMERFDIADMIRNYLESASLLARQADAELIFTRTGGLCVWGDPFLIQEVFQNYYTNALHHVQAAGRVRRASEGQTSAGTGSAVFLPAETAVSSSVSPTGAEDPAVSGSFPSEKDKAVASAAVFPAEAPDPAVSGSFPSEKDKAAASPALFPAEAEDPAPEDERVIDIRLELRGNIVRVTVFNTGMPIPAEALPHIWEKFYKVDKARTRAYGGSGVGLSIVKAIMDLHHHAYGADNYENGVAFWFELDYAGEADPSPDA